MQFSVTCDPPLLEDDKHVLSKDGDPVLDERISIEENVILFTSVQEKDAGEYTITSSNGIGKGQNSFTITVLSMLLV